MEDNREGSKVSSRGNEIRRQIFGAYSGLIKYI